MQWLKEKVVVVFIGPAFPFNIYTADLVNRKARRKPLVEQELRTLPEHPISSPVFLIGFVLLKVVFCR
jgi:hypothetical protein